MQHERSRSDLERELMEKKSVFIAAALFGLLPPFLRLLGAFRNWDSSRTGQRRVIAGRS